MAKFLRALNELIPERVIKSIIKIDAPVVSSNPDRYCQENLLGYYVLINTWLMIIKEYSRLGWQFVLDHIQNVGLFTSIKEFDEAAQQLVHGQAVEFSLARSLMVDIKNSVPIIGIPIDDAKSQLATDPMAIALFVFRYPKRFSPLYADSLKETSFKGFQDTQKRLKQWQRRPMPMFIIERVREAAANMINWDRLCDELDDVSLQDVVFTPGVSFDTSASLLSKLQSMAREHVEYFPQPFGIPVIANRGIEEQCYTHWGQEVHCVRLVGVPKNYKTARVIAPENVYRQALARRYFQICDRYLPDQIKLHDQTQNQRIAYWGSITGQWATIDLSAASDSLTPTLLRSILPARFMKIMDRVLPNFYMLGDRMYLMQSAATMGNSMTFWLESVVFASVANAAVACFNRFTGEYDDTISVYGDDIIVPTDAALTVMEWLSKLGFLVNYDKSFYDRDNLYRESCGEEYFQGTCVSGKYFPRFPLEGKLGGSLSNRKIRDGFTGTVIDTMTALIDLQHKLFNTCLAASLLVVDIVHEASPKMTHSTPDMGLNDLYMYESTGVQVPAPCWIRDKDEWKKSGNPEYPRDGHYAPITVYSEPKGLSPDDEMLVHLYNYLQFLKFGPRYDSELDRSLRVSSPPISISEAATTAVVKWVLVK
jgi:hypothetical protein